MRGEDMARDLTARLLDERNHLVDLLDADLRPVTDTGWSFVEGTAELVYESGGHRYELTMREMPA